MYQYTTTNVINSQYVKDYDGNNLLLSDGSTPIASVTGSATGLVFPKIGTFKKDNIVSIYKRPYQPGVKEIAEIVIPNAITAGKVARLEIVLNLSGSTQSEFVNYALEFKKPIVVEVLATGTDTLDAQALVDQLNALKTRFGSKYFTAARSGAKVVITCADPYIRVKSMKILTEPANYSSTMGPEYTDVSSTTFDVTTDGKVGFGDDNWMTRRVMLQTAENVRYFGISKAERPVLGGMYSEYVLRYSVTKDGTDGTVSGGTSVTTHVFYVKSDLVGLFELAIYNVGLNIISLESEQTFTLTATDDTTAAVKIDISNIVPFISAASEITASSSVEGKGTIGAITVATPTGTPLAQTARIVITKVQAGATTISVTIDGVTKTKAITIG